MRIRKLLSSIAVIAIAAGGGALVAQPGAQLSTSEVEAPLVTAEGGTVSLVCTGGVSRTIEQGVNASDTAEDITGSAGALVSGGQAQWLDAEAASTAEPTDVRDLVGANSTSQLGAPELRGSFVLSGDQLSDTIVSGASIHRAQAGDLRGLAINPCVWSDSSVWLVGSSGEVGTSNRLLLANPGLTPVTIQIEAFSSLGRMDLGSSGNVVLAPGAQDEIILDGIVDPDARLAMRLTADSGRFGATLQTTSLDGYTPAGVTFVSPSESGREVTVPGVVIGGIEATGDTVRADPNQSARLRVVNPSDALAKVSIQTRGPDGLSDLPGGTDVSVIAGGVLDLTLEGLAPGTYDVVVTSDSDISAGVVMERGTDADGRDTAWAAARPAMTRAGAAISGTANLALSGSGPVTWTTYDADGAPVADGTETLGAGTTVVKLEGASYVTVASDNPFHGAVHAQAVASGENVIEWVPLVSHGAATQSVRVAVKN